MKKFIAAALAIVTAALQIPLVASAATNGIVYGDVNESGTVEISDATEVQRFLVDEAELTDTQKKVADVDADGEVTITDVTYIQRFVGGVIDKFPADDVSANKSLVIDYSLFDNKEKTDDEKLYTELFDTNSVVSIKLNISNAELQKIEDDYNKYKNMGSKSPIYRKVDSVEITINGKTYTIEEVGIKMKGNTSRTSFFNNGEMTNLVHFKLDFQETFDDEAYYGSDAKVWTDKAERKARKNRTFATLEKLDMKWNSTYDSTYVRQQYCYEMYRDFGLLAAHSVPATTTIGNTYCGIYSLDEPIDSIFLAKYLPADEQGGDLYKCGWTNNGATFTTDCSMGAEDEDNCLFYNYDIKTNKKTTTHEALKTMISTLNSSSLNNDAYESVVDKDYFATFAAVSYFTGNCDDMRNCYNNYYVYFRPNGQAVFLPYDFDRCLGITYNADPSGNGMTEVSPYSDTAMLQKNSQKNPVYSYAITKTGAYKTEYSKELNRVANSKWVSYDTFKPYYEASKNNYGSSVYPSKSLGNVNTGYLPITSSNCNMSVGSFLSRITTYYNNNFGGTGESTYTINVNLPENTPADDTIYLASSWNSWKPQDSAYAFTRTSATTATITLDASGHLGETLSFKITRGSWSNAECLYSGSTSVGTDGAQNHTATVTGGKTLNLNVEAWVDLLAA